MTDESTPPSAATEALVTRAWMQVFALADVPRDTSFFDLGGTSLQALQTVALLQDAGLDVEIGDLFEHPTIAELVAALSAGRAD